MRPNPFEKFRRVRSPTQEKQLTASATSRVQRNSKRPRIKKKDSASDKAAPEPGLPEKLGDEPLRLIIVGHNPSEHAWRSGHYYSNPSNRMWKILRTTGIAPDVVKSAEDDDLMLSHAGVGFTDVGWGIPGTDSSLFTFKIRRQWSEGFLYRLKKHIDRCNETIGCQCGECGAPRVLAFAGKTHFLAVYNATCSSDQRIKTASVGKQDVIPETWPLPKKTEVWVLPSTSGAAALTNEDRERPFHALAECLMAFPWPERRRPECHLTSCTDNRCH